jgi:hypothetical protein
MVTIDNRERVQRTMGEEAMTHLQFYILVAIPLVGILANTGLFIHLSTRIDTLGGRIDTHGGRVDTLRAHFDARFETLLGKLVEVDNRLTRVEDRMNIR